MSSKTSAPKRSISVQFEADDYRFIATVARLSDRSMGAFLRMAALQVASEQLPSLVVQEEKVREAAAVLSDAVEAQTGLERNVR